MYMDNKKPLYLIRKTIFVHPTRFELISMVPETIILSIELRVQYLANIVIYVFE